MRPIAVNGTIPENPFHGDWFTLKGRKDDGWYSSELRFERPVTIRSMELPPPSTLNHAWCYQPELDIRFEALSDFGAAEVVNEAMPQGTWQESKDHTIACKEATSDRWRLSLRNRHDIDLRFVRFRTAARMENWEGQAGWTLRGMTPPKEIFHTPGTCLRKGEVVDVSSFMDTNGNFRWTPPHEGDWTIVRFGHVNTGAKNGPAPKEATGWECDKLSKRGAEAHFAGYVERLRQGPLAGKLKGMVIDSWECERQTWTQEMETEFKARRGYALRPWLPTLFGWIVEDDQTTETFLLDWRRTISELCTENYYGRMAQLAHEHGLSVQYETGFGDVFPGDLLEFWKYADEPMCEFWVPATRGYVGDLEFKPTAPCVSAAHIYGKKRVTAESFTGFKLTWDEDLRSLKQLANRYLARGITHLVFHTYTHDPIEKPVPPGSSMGAWIGTPFVRTQTCGATCRFSRTILRVADACSRQAIPCRTSFGILATISVTSRRRLRRSPRAIASTTAMRMSSSIV